MNNKSELIVNYRTTIFTIISWIVGVLFFTIGVINTFWGNDTGFGIFVMLLSFAFFPPFTDFVRKKFGLGLPAIAKVVLGLFIVWAAVGVGELFDKVDIMMKSF